MIIWYLHLKVRCRVIDIRTLRQATRWVDHRRLPQFVFEQSAKQIYGRADTFAC